MGEIKSLIEKRYNFNDTDNKVDLAIKPVPYDRNLCAAANVETLKYKLLTGTPVRMAANNILGTVMRRGMAIGCEVIVSGKVRGQRAKAQKYAQGYQVSTGQPKYDFIDSATRSVELRQGFLVSRSRLCRAPRSRSDRRRRSCPTSSRSTSPRMRTPLSRPRLSPPSRTRLQPTPPPS